MSVEVSKVMAFSSIEEVKEFLTKQGLDEAQINEVVGNVETEDCECVDCLKEELATLHAEKDAMVARHEAIKVDMTAGKELQLDKVLAGALEDGKRALEIVKRIKEIEAKLNEATDSFSEAVEELYAEVVEKISKTHSFRGEAEQKAFEQASKITIAAILDNALND